MSEKPTQKTVEAIQRWTMALRRVQDSKAKLNNDECELLNATNELGKWLTPDDAKQGEVFDICDGDGIISVWSTRDDRSEFKAEWRKRKTTHD